MLLKTFLTTFFSLLTINTQTYAQSYENWESLYQNSYAKINHVYDQELERNVTKFESKSSRDTYINGAKQGKKAWNNSNDKILQWQFKYTQSYVIIVSVNTLDGHRNILYTSGNDDGNLYFGLGEDTMNGEWQTVTRDLEYDLHHYEPRNSIVTVNAFLIRGSGKVATVELLNAVPGHPAQSKPKRQGRVPKEVVREHVTVATVAPKKSQQSDNTLPTISLKKGDLIYQQLGQPFFDPGVTARDGQGRALDVDVLGEVNINKVNKYTLTYIATDAQGNTATEARVVMVYKPGLSEQNTNQAKSIAKKATASQEEEDNFLELPPLAPVEEVPQRIEIPEFEENNLRQEEMLELLRYGL